MSAYYRIIILINARQYIIQFVYLKSDQVKLNVKQCQVDDHNRRWFGIIIIIIIIIIAALAVAAAAIVLCPSLDLDRHHLSIDNVRTPSELLVNLLVSDTELINRIQL